MPSPSPGYSSAHKRDPYRNDHDFSKPAFNGGPLYDKRVDRAPIDTFDPTYSNPHFVQQEYIDEPIPGKLEQIPLSAKSVVPHKSFDDFSEPRGYIKSDTPQLPFEEEIIPKYTKLEQSPIDRQVPIDEQKVIIDPHPIDQQVFINEPEEVPLVLQKPLDEEAKFSQVSEDVPLIKNVPIPIQQTSVDDIPFTSNVKYLNEDNVPQVFIGDNPPQHVINESPIVQQVLDNDAKHVLKQLPYDDGSVNYRSPAIQKTIDEHPSQAVYDSPIEPSFSDNDHYPPPHSFKTKPRYRFVPIGPSYERITHSTEVIHGPHRQFYPPRPPPKKYTSHFPTNKIPPVSHSFKLPPPPPPPLKSSAPLNSPYEQKHLDSDIIHTKNSPPYNSFPAPVPITKKNEPVILSQAQEYIDEDVLSIKSPSIKLPTPAPITKTVIPVDLSQEHVDSGLISPKYQAVPHSVKLPPPAPVTKTVIPAELPVAQEHVDAHILADGPQSIKLAPPITKSYGSVKEPVPPVTKSVVPKIQAYEQQDVDDAILSTKNVPVSPSVKLPPPAVVKYVAPPVLAQEQEPLDIPLTVKSPHSVKQPSTYKSPPIDPPHIKEPSHGHKSSGSPEITIPSVVSHFSNPSYSDTIPPAPHSVKHPSSTFSHLSNSDPYGDDSEAYLDAPLTEISPISHGVKQLSDVHSVKHPSTKNSPNVKTPHVNPHFRALSSAGDRHKYPPSHLDDHPPDYTLTARNNGRHPDLEGGLNSNIPPEPHFDESFDEKSGFDKYPPVSHAVRLPSVIPSSELKPSEDSDEEISGIDESSPFDKYNPVSHAVRLPISPKVTPVPNLFKAVPSVATESDGILSDDPSDSEFPAPKSEALRSPVSHSVRLSLPVRRHKVDDEADKPKQDFPAFPVESALKHPDPVADKVAELTNSFTPGTGYSGSIHEPLEPDDEAVNSPSVDEAKAEIDRVNSEIGLSFGNRLFKRSRFSRS